MNPVLLSASLDQVPHLHSTCIKVYVCISPVDLQFWLFLLTKVKPLVSSLCSLCTSTVDLPAGNLWLPAQSEETNFLSTFFMSITLITVWPASSSECCHSTDEPNYCIWDYFQFKVSFSLATNIMYYAVCPTEQYNAIFWHKQVQDISPGRQN